MCRHLCGLSLFGFLTICSSGCSLVQPPDSAVSTEERPQLSVQPVMSMDVILVNEQGPLPKIDPAELKPGQHVQLLTGENLSGENLSGDFLDEVEMLSRSFAGTVKANDGERLVLQDFVMINEVRSQTGVPIVNNVPYFSRLFKNSSVARRQGISIPGEVALDRSKIRFACELTDDSFKTIRQNGGYERIGVDFDFNVVDSLEATPQL